MTGNPQEPQERQPDIGELIHTLGIQSDIYVRTKTEAEEAQRKQPEAFRELIHTTYQLLSAIETDPQLTDLEKAAWLSAVDEIRDNPKELGSANLIYNFDQSLNQKFAAYNRIQKLLDAPGTTALLGKHLVGEHRERRVVLVDIFKTDEQGASIELLPTNPMGRFVKIAGPNRVCKAEILDLAAQSAGDVTAEFSKQTQNDFILIGEETIAAYLKYIISPGSYYSAGLKEVIYREARKADIDLAKDPEIAEWLDGRRREITHTYIQNLLKEMRAAVDTRGLIANRDWVSHHLTPSDDEKLFGVTTEHILNEAETANERYYELTAEALGELIALSLDHEPEA